MKGAGGQGYKNIEGEFGHFFRYRVVVSIGVETHVSIPVHPIIRYLRPISFIGLGLWHESVAILDHWHRAVPRPGTKSSP